MQPGIGGAQAPAPDIGSLLAGGAMPQAGPGPDAMLQDALGQVRQIGQAVDTFVQAYPMLAPVGQQITQLLKQAVIQLAQQQSAQPTATSTAVPGGGA